MNFKKMLTVALALTIMAGSSLIPAADNKTSFLASSVVSVSAATRVNSIEQEMSYYKQGEYWNHGVIDKSSKKPCDHKKDGIKYCNHVNGDHWQCEGFAEKIAYDIYGTYPHGNSKQKAWNSENGTIGYNKVKRGDVIRDYNAPHSFMIIDVNGNTLTVGECNEQNKQCKINWKRTIKKSDLNESYIQIYYAPYEAPYSEIDSTEKAPALGTVWVEGNLYTFKQDTQTYSDRTGKHKAEIIRAGKRATIKHFYTVNNGKDTVGMIDSKHYVLLRKNNVLGVEVTVTTNYNTGVNLREKPNTDCKVYGAIPNGTDIQITACNGSWAKTKYKCVTGYVNLSICKAKK